MFISNVMDMTKYYIQLDVTVSEPVKNIMEPFVVDRILYTKNILLPEEPHNAHTYNSL